VNPIDPLSVGIQSASLAYFLAVARELKEIRKGARRTNPDLAGRIERLERKLVEVGSDPRANPINWPETIALGAGTAIGGAVGAAIAEPVLASLRKKKRKNPLTATQRKRLSNYRSRVDDLDVRLAKTRSWSKNHKNLTSRRLKLERKIEDLMSKARDGCEDAVEEAKRTNPTLLIASNPQNSDPAAHEHKKAYKKALRKYREFFGEDPPEVIEVPDPPGSKLPEYMIALGRSQEVMYKPDDHTSKKGVPFVHKFGEEGGKQPYLVTDPSGRLLAYADGSYRVDDWIRD